MEDEAGQIKSGMQCPLVALKGTPSDDHDVFFNLRMTYKFHLLCHNYDLPMHYYFPYVAEMGFDKLYLSLSNIVWLNQIQASLPYLQENK